MRNPSSFVSILPMLPKRWALLFSVGFVAGLLGTFAWASAPSSESAAHEAVAELLEDSKPIHREMEYQIDRLELRQGAAVRVNKVQRKPGFSEVRDENDPPVVRGIIGVDGDSDPSDPAPAVQYESSPGLAPENTTDSGEANSYR